MGIKGFTTLQRLDRSLAHKVGGHLVTLAKPESQHVVAAYSCVGNFTDTGGLKVLDGWAHGGQ